MTVITFGLLSGPNIFVYVSPATHFRLISSRPRLYHIVPVNKLSKEEKLTIKAANLKSDKNAFFQINKHYSNFTTELTKISC